MRTVPKSEISRAQTAQVALDLACLLIMAKGNDYLKSLRDINIDAIVMAYHAHRSSGAYTCDPLVVTDLEEIERSIKDGEDNTITADGDCFHSHFVAGATWRVWCLHDA